MKKTIAPKEATQFGHAIVDVREFPEYAAGSILGSQLVPLATLGREAGQWDKKKPVLLVCRSGRRAGQAAETLERLGFEDVNVLEGGMEAWQREGLPVQTSARQPWSMERQVRAIAGGMILVLTLLGLTVSPWFFAGTLFVASGLVLAGVTDVCLMATLLGKLPWNRATRCEM